MGVMSRVESSRSKCECLARAGDERLDNRTRDVLQFRVIEIVLSEKEGETGELEQQLLQQGMEYQSKLVISDLKHLLRVNRQVSTLYEMVKKEG